MPQFMGRAEIRIGGVLYATDEGAKLTNPMGESRDPVVGARVYGYTVKTETPMIEATFFMSDAITLDDLWGLQDETATFEADNGQTFLLVNATMASIDDITSGDKAKVSIKIMGTDCQQQ